MDDLRLFFQFLDSDPGFWFVWGAILVVALIALIVEPIAGELWARWKK